MSPNLKKYKEFPHLNDKPQEFRNNIYALVT